MENTKIDLLIDFKKAIIGQTGLFKTDTPNTYEVSTITDIQMVYHTESGSSYFEEDLKGYFLESPEEWLKKNKTE